MSKFILLIISLVFISCTEDVDQEDQQKETIVEHKDIFRDEPLESGSNTFVSTLQVGDQIKVLIHGLNQSLSQGNINSISSRSTWIEQRCFEIPFPVRRRHCVDIPRNGLCVMNYAEIEENSISIQLIEKKLKGIRFHIGLVPIIMEYQKSFEDKHSFSINISKQHLMNGNDLFVSIAMPEKLKSIAHDFIGYGGRCDGKGQRNFNVDHSQVAHQTENYNNQTFYLSLQIKRQTEVTNE